MSSSEVNIVALMRPRKGQTKKVLDLIQEAANHVEKNEQGTDRYEIYSSLRPSKEGTDTICMVERYKHKQALKDHGGSEPFMKFQSELSKQDLLLAPPVIHVLARRGGFSSRL
ncbi:hypothetical protein B0A48_17609 [Cryoendolithus antarcticus]|uniref:ABM domain-containing protein n=1 Tax=Cryoendolithus antarcticus TaxID=1507870 RepID=A0A1V8SBI0_9PEZI|nr:hypothetical protein B0A48_17609 [Cryoendolithus antarcticus]